MDVRTPGSGGGAGRSGTRLSFRQDSSPKYVPSSLELQRAALSDLSGNVGRRENLEATVHHIANELAQEDIAERAAGKIRVTTTDSLGNSNNNNNNNMYKEEEEFWEARSKILRKMGEEEGDAASCSAKVELNVGAEDEDGEVFLDEKFLVDSILASRGSNESEESRRRKLQLHKWLVSLATFRDELSLIVQAIHQQKGKIVEQKMKEQGIQLQFLDKVVQQGKAFMSEKITDMRNVQHDAKTFMQKCARVIYGQEDWSDEFPSTFQQFNALREQLSNEYLVRDGSSSTSKRDFYDFLKEVHEQTKRLSHGRPLLYKVPRDSLSGGGDDAVDIGPRSTRLMKEFEDIARWIELRHIKEIKELREHLSSSLDIKLASDGTAEGPSLSEYPDSTSVYDLMQQMVEGPTSFPAKEGDDKSSKGDIGSFYHSAYRKVLLAIQKAHHREKTLLHGTIRGMGEKKKELTEQLAKQASLLKEKDHKIAVLREESKLMDVERERQKVQMLEAMKKMDIIREKEREMALADERQRDEERALEAVKERKRAEAKALEKEREIARQREREVEAKREEEREEERRLEKSKDKNREKERALARDREKKLKQEREAEREAEIVRDRERAEERNAEILAKKTREMEKEFEQRKIEQMQKEIEKYRIDLENDQKTLQMVRAETEESLQKKFASTLELERERLEREKEKFYLLNPNTDDLKEKLKAAADERDRMQEDIVKLKEELESSKEYFSYAQQSERSDYEQKVQELHEKVSTLAATFKKLPPPMVCPPAPSNGIPEFGDNSIPENMESSILNAAWHAQPNSQDGIHIQLLNDLKGLKSKIAKQSGRSSAFASVSSTPSSESETSSSTKQDDGFEAGPSFPRKMKDSGLVPGQDLESDEKKAKLKEIAKELSSVSLVSNVDGGQSEQLSSKVVDLVKTINKISPQVWKETAKAASLSSTNVLDELLERESRASKASKKEEAEESARMIRKGLRLL